jgi:hypothetical protein
MMILILFESRFASDVDQITADIEKAFRGNVEVGLLPAETGGVWPALPAWDDLLLILFDTNVFPHPGNKLIDDFMLQRGRRALVLPIAINPAQRRPPPSAENIKALPYNNEAKGESGRLIKRIGGMLGLRLQGRDSKIFISYRATDGTLIADQIYSHLSAIGHSPWQDQAIELDGDTKILPGSEVQVQIDDVLASASLVLLIDSPMAHESKWIRHEVETADSMLIPILPICFKSPFEVRKGPRFRSLLLLQRWVEIDNVDIHNANPLSNDQLERVVLEIETYLCEIFRRKCRVPFIVEKEFLHYGFDWTVKDKPLYMFGSVKVGGRLSTTIISHCSIFDQIYKPSMQRFRKYVNQSDKANYSLFIYDGDLLSDEELANMLGNDEGEVVVLHHQELSSLISSNFKNLGTS